MAQAQQKDAKPIDDKPRQVRPLRLAVVILSTVVAGGGLTGVVLNKLAERRPPRSWPMEPQEIASFKGAGSDFRDLSDSLAGSVADVITISINGQTGRIDRRNFLQYILAPRVMEIATTQSAIYSAAERRCGVAVVPSGATWVERRP